MGGTEKGLEEQQEKQEDEVERGRSEWGEERIEQRQLEGLGKLIHY